MISIEHSILKYRFCDEDFKIYNPYLKNLYKLISENRNSGESGLVSLLLSERHEFVSQYSFTIPYYEILKLIASYSPIVEIGAGSGYWARCLSEMGADILAYDRFPPGEHNHWEWHKGNPWFDDSWYGITEGDETAAALHPERALFIAWPVPMNPMAYNALMSYKKAGGRTVIYIGDPQPESSGDEFFYSELFAHREIENRELYSWPGTDEKLLIYSLG